MAEEDEEELEDDVIDDELEEDEVVQQVAVVKAPIKNVEDLHVCGACESVFSDVEVFVDHKRKGCPKQKRRQTHRDRRLLPQAQKQKGITVEKASASADDSGPETAFNFAPHSKHLASLDIFTESNSVPET